MQWWSLGNEIYMFIAICVGIVLIFLTTRLSRAIARRIVPKDLPEGLKNAQKILASIIAIALGIAIAFPIISFIIARFGVDVTPALRAVGNWFIEHGIIILIIIIGAYIVNKVITVLLPSIIYRLVKVRGEGQSAQEEIKKRSSTLSRFLTSVSTVLIAVMAIFMVLSEIGVDIAPLLVGAGFAGVAVGFAGQRLISDILNGLFIIIEDYYSAGDVVKVAGISGLVEDVNIRRTILRDLDGVVHIISNGQIETASNLTRNWSRVNLDISVGYGEDLDRVIGILNRVGREIAQDEHFGPMIINVPQVLRVDNLGDSGIEIKILGETQPIKQWEVMGELRKRIKKAFDDEGIEIPWPHTKVYFGNAPWENDGKGFGTRAKSQKSKKRPPVVAYDNSGPLPPDSSGDD